MLFIGVLQLVVLSIGALIWLNIVYIYIFLMSENFENEYQYMLISLCMGGSRGGGGGSGPSLKITNGFLRNSGTDHPRAGSNCFSRVFRTALCEIC